MLNAATFQAKVYVQPNPRGISFSLTTPKPAKPQPPARPPSPGPQVEQNTASSKRAAAAAFFLSEKLVQVWQVITPNDCFAHLN